jgi:hypothetical protein
MIVRRLYCALTEVKSMKVVRTLLICTLLLSLVPAADALNPDRDIHQLAHRWWGAGVCQIVGRWDRRHPCKALGTARCSPLPSHCRSRRAEWKTRGAFRLCLLQSGMDRPNHSEVNQYLKGLRHPMIFRTSVVIDNRSRSNRSRWEAGKNVGQIAPIAARASTKRISPLTKTHDL